MRIIEKQAWAVDALWIPNTWDYLESLSYTKDTECDAEVKLIVANEKTNNACINEQKDIIENPKQFKDVWEEINALAEILYVEPDVTGDGESASQDTHGQITLELPTADNEEGGKKNKRKKSLPRRLLGRIKKIFGRKKIK